MAGNPADMTVAPYKDGDVTHDHTYIGNGCSSTNTGSKTPCPASDAGGRIVETADNEDQKNGTYYNFQAITSGSGVSIKTDDSNASDSFCPLGWQLSYSGTGGDYYDKSRSWNYLFSTYSIPFGSGIVADDTKVRSYPFSYIYSGNFAWASGLLFVQSYAGQYWSSTVHSEWDAHSFAIYSSKILPANTDGRARGFTLRCI